MTCKQIGIRIGIGVCTTSSIHEGGDDIFEHRISCYMRQTLVGQAITVPCSHHAKTSLFVGELQMYNAKRFSHFVTQAEILNDNIASN